MKHFVLISILTVIMYSCSESPKSEEVFNFEALEFPYSSIKNSLELSKDIDNYHNNHKRLDSIQKRHLLPNITEDLSMDEGYLYSSFFLVSLVSKQDLIDSIQPIILHAFADDFSALIYVTLNKEHQPIDYLFVDREEYCGGDDSTSCEKFRHSIFNGSEIISYDLFKFTSTITNELLYTDSIVYISKVNADGKIKTSKLDSFRIMTEPKDSTTY